MTAFNIVKYNLNNSKYTTSCRTANSDAIEEYNKKVDAYNAENRGLGVTLLIVVIVVPIVVVILIVVGIILCCCCCKRRKDKHNSTHSTVVFQQPPQTMNGPINY